MGSKASIVLAGGVVSLGEDVHDLVEVKDLLGGDYIHILGQDRGILEERGV